MNAEELKSHRKKAPESIGSKINRLNKNPLVKLAKMIFAIGEGDSEGGAAAGPTVGQTFQPKAPSVKDTYGGYQGSEFDIEKWERMQRDHMAYRKLIDGKGDHDCDHDHDHH